MSYEENALSLNPSHSHNKILQLIKEQYLDILGNNLTGIYVHGSIAFDCFNWEKSDIDFIVVINEKIDIETKLKLLWCLETLRPEFPKKGPEMSVVLKEYCLHFQYPTPYELHFSYGWLERYLTDPLLLCGDDRKVDPDLAAHFTVINAVGKVLYGQPIPEVFSPIDKSYYIDSIINDISDAENEILQNPLYILLNLCRVAAYIKDGLVLSKEAGGEWGLINLPSNYHPLLQEGLDCYHSDRQMENPSDLAVAFSRFMIAEIMSDRG